MPRDSATTDVSSEDPFSASVAYRPPSHDESALSETPDDLPPQVSTPQRLATQFASTAGVAFAIVGLQMGQGILLARILGPTGRGEYATAIFFVQMLLYIGLFGGLEVICRYAAAAELNATKLRRAALKLALATGSITTLIAIILSTLALPAEKRYLIPMALLCTLSITGQQVMLIMTAVDRGRGQFGVYNIRRVIAAAAFPILLLVTQLTLGVSLQIACGLFVVASAVSMAACLTRLPKPLTGPSEPGVAPLLKEGRPYAFSMLATDLFERLDLLLVLWIAGLQDQGYYAAMVPVAYPLTVLPNTLGLFLFNAAADQKRRLTTRDVHRILGLSIAVQTVCTVMFMLLIGTIVVWLYGSAFAPAVRFAMWLAPVAAIKGILQGLDSYVKGRGKPLVAVRCRIVAMALMILLTWLLSDRYGAVAVAMSALASQVLCLIWLSAIIYADVRGNKVEESAS